MFTGLIQQIGRFAGIENIAGGARLRIAAAWPTQLVRGESIAVNGACLTVAEVLDAEFVCDVLRETLARTCLGGKRPGARLNLERALRLGDAVGGHLVTGHIDGTGIVKSRRSVGRDLVLSITCDQELMPGIVPKGSIALDGVSLTVAELDSDTFAVHMIPTTLDETSLGELKVGDLVNLETDMIGKYVARCLQKQASETPPITMSRMHNAGF